MRGGLPRCAFLDVSARHAGRAVSKDNEHPQMTPGTVKHFIICGLKAVTFQLLKSFAWAFGPPIGMKIGDFQRSGHPFRL
jgi:hypothetical protein